MKDELPKKINEIECGIVNVQNSNQCGSHWVAYYKNNNKRYYFDSYGYAPPPKKLDKYLGPENLDYNSERIQYYNDPPICGHLCLIVLEKLSKDSDWKNILRNIGKKDVERIVQLLKSRAVS